MKDNSNGNLQSFENNSKIIKIENQKLDDLNLKNQSENVAFGCVFQKLCPSKNSLNSKQLITLDGVLGGETHKPENQQSIENPIISEFSSDVIFEIFDALIENSKEAIKNNEIPVSCCFVKTNNSANDKKYNIITIHHNLTNKTKNATNHCEINCIKSYDKTDLSDVYVFVTVEPCLMCGYALLLLEPKMIYYILPNQKFGGVESLYNLNLKTAKIDYKSQIVKGMLQNFYEIGNKNLEENKRHRFKAKKNTKNELKRIKQE